MIFSRRHRVSILAGSAFLFFILGGLIWHKSRLAGELLSSDISADVVEVDKAAIKVTLVAEGEPIKSYRISLGGNPVGTKLREGDQKTPEGEYKIVGRNPQSSYHLSLRIGYPTEAQHNSAVARGEDPGGDIMIHGIRNGLGLLGSWHRLFDWTAGCIAVTNPEIEEIWRAVADGTRIVIRR